MNARERALDAQRKLNWFSNHENGIVWARSWRATEGLPLGMRYAELGAARLAALDFLHDPEEPLIGDQPNHLAAVLLQRGADSTDGYSHARQHAKSQRAAQPRQYCQLQAHQANAVRIIRNSP